MLTFCTSRTGAGRIVVSLSMLFKTGIRKGKGWWGGRCTVFPFNSTREKKKSVLDESR